jgi:glycosyltransferase involved in cell wall biosynthesis
LAETVDLEVYYCHRQTPSGQAGAGFGVAFDWDVPMFDGYSHRFLHNRARRPDVSSFWGCDTPEIAGMIERARFDAFIVQGWAMRSFWQAIAACRRSRTPVLVRGDSHLLKSRQGMWRLVKYPVYRTFIPRFDAYLVVGARSREYLLHYGARNDRMFFTPHAVDNDFFMTRAAALHPERARLRAQWGIPVDAVVALFAGKMIAVKRPQDFVRGVGRAGEDGPDIWGLMAGDGPLRPAAETLARENNWRVRFCGFRNQTEMPGVYAASDVLVLPSQESWGLVVNEAMASGLPAVVSDAVGCLPDLVKPSHTGEVFAHGDVAGLASTLSRLARDVPGMRALGEQAARHIERYSISEAVSGTLAALRAVRRQSGSASLQRHAVKG